MRIVVVGTGYVALSAAVSLAKLGHNVICVDDNVATIELLSNAIVTINEQDLSKMLACFIETGQLKFTTNLKESLKDAEIIICGVVTPINDTNGSADNTPILNLAESIGEYISTSILYISLSTVPLGTTRQVKTIVENILLKRKVQFNFNVASLPEFLREGVAIESFLNPAKVVIGSDSQKSYQTIISLLAPTIKENTPIYSTSIEEAELIKLASNMLVATRISYMNTVAQVCDRIGAEYSHIHNAIFGAMPIYVGAGYSGECFPKDVRTLIKGVDKVGADATMVRAIEEFNQNQKLQLYYKLKDYYSGNLQDKHIAIWGVAAKNGTTDIGNTPSVETIKQLLNEGVHIVVYDKIASDKIIEQFPNNKIRATKDKYKALTGADALIIFTDASEFKNVDFNILKEEMNTPLILDAKNLFNNKDIKEAGIIYYSLFK